MCDNDATHKHPSVKAWLAKTLASRLRFTQTSGSWLNIVEIFFKIITRHAIRRGTVTSVKDLIAAIRTFIDGWNDRCEPSSGPTRPTKSSRAPPEVKTVPKRDARKSGRARSKAKEFESQPNCCAVITLYARRYMLVR